MKPFRATGALAVALTALSMFVCASMDFGEAARLY
jgi:hypothetical protein